MISAHVTPTAVLPRILFAIAHQLFRRSDSFPHQSLKRALGQWAKLSRGSWLAVALLLLANSPAQAAAGGVLSFDLEGNRANVRWVSSADGEWAQQRRSSLAWSPASEQLGSAEMRSTSQAFAVQGSLGRDEGAISLSLSKPALVAAAPLSLSNSAANSVGRLSQTRSSEQRSTSVDQAKADQRLASAATIPETWWHQGAESPIAVAIGSAEGTRRADGSKTTAYYWHVDPGNGADNFGTFSYQHFPSSMTVAVQRQATTLAKREAAAQAQLPEMADHEQMQRLRGFHDELQAQAAARKIELSQIEIVNGLDLANQSEAAALSVEGYIDRITQMKGLTDDVEEQILEARTWSYWDPNRRQWNAPGLGNTYEKVRRDQERRYAAIQRAMNTYPLAQPTSTTMQLGASPVRSEESAGNVIGNASKKLLGSRMGDDAIADRIIQFKLPS